MNKAQKILFVTRSLPYPVMGGDEFVMDCITEALKNTEYEIDLLFYKRSNKDIKNIEKVKQRFGFKNCYYEKPEPKFNWNNFKQWWFGSKSLLFLRFYSEKFSDKILELIKNGNYSAIVFEHTFMYGNVLFNPELEKEIKKQKLKTVINTHVVEFNVWEEALKKENFNPVKKFILEKEVKYLKKYELRSLRKAGKSIFLSEEDKQRVRKYIPGYKDKFHVLNIVPDLENYEYSPPELEKENTIYFLGSYSWIQNKNAIKYFIKEIFPLVLEKNPKAKLHLIGTFAGFSIQALALGRNIVFRGKVKSIYEEIKKYSVMVLPLQISGGTRIKLIESLCWGKSVVASNIAVEGIDLQGKMPVIVADEKEKFADEVLRLLGDKEKMINLKHQARNFAENNFNFEDFKEKYLKILEH